MKTLNAGADPRFSDRGSGLIKFSNSINSFLLNDVLSRRFIYMPHDEVRDTPSDQKGAVPAERRVFPALSGCGHFVLLRTVPEL